MAQPSPVPVRFPSGLSTDFPYGPLANMGQPNPFMYHIEADDFDMLATTYTATKTTAGTIASVAGDGGLLLFTTNATTPLVTDIASLQNPVANFANIAGKKMHFLTRLQTSDVVNSAILAGLIQTTTTPFTVTDGIYFSKPTGSSTNLVLISMIASVATTLVIPTSAYTLTNGTNVDLGFFVDRSGNIMAFVGSLLVGWIAQSGTGTPGPTRGPCASFAPTITTAVLAPTLAIQSGSATSKTMTVDFMLASRER